MSFVEKKGLTLFDWVNYSLLILISAACLFPFVYVFSVSLTDSSVYRPFTLYLIPEKFSLGAYKYILSAKSFQQALGNTAFITLAGTVLCLLFSFTMAYGLTKKTLPHRKWIMGTVILCLVFNAGIVPNYLLVKQLGLMNSHWALIWMGLMSSFNLIVIKSFMESLPGELEDSAKIDGCNELSAFIRIILPLSKPALAAFALFFAVMHWNTYFNAMLFLSDSKKWTLQVLVKHLILDSSTAMEGAASSEERIPQETVRLASVVVAMLPILIVYPFLQKYFAKGVLLGSVKG